MGSERRQAPRYPFIADAAVIEISSDTKLAAKTSDLSIGGCFLDMLNPTPQGTEVRVRISHEGATFTALGKVVFILPNMGMGVIFTSVEQDQQAIPAKMDRKPEPPRIACLYTEDHSRATDRQFPTYPKKSLESHASIVILA
jgi:hypothetical protein